MDMAANQPNAFLRWLFRIPVHLYRWRCGWLLGHRFLLLIHIGRRTGQRHRTVLEVMEYRRHIPEMIVMSAFGPRAAWLRNIEAAKHATIVIGSRRFAVVHRLLDEAEAIQVIARYESRNRLLAPVLRAALSRFVGWRYDGTDQARRRLAAALPLVAFRPKNG